MNTYKPQKKWKTKADNTQLISVIPNHISIKIGGLINYSKNYFENFFTFVLNNKSYTLPKSEISLIQTQPALIKLVQQLQNQRIITFKIFNQEHRSFKGYITWITISTFTKIYLIDVLKLRTVFSIIKKIFENELITKVGIQISNQLHYLQRDFDIFTLNVFDFKEILVSQNYSLETVILLKDLFGIQIKKIIDLDKLYKRPLDSQYYQYLTLHSSIIIKFLNQLNQLFPNCFKQNFQNVYAASNLLTRNPYCHRSQQFSLIIQEILNAKQNFLNFSKEVHASQEKKIKRLLKWREHTAKIKDESVEYILPKKIITEIIHRQVKSIKQLDSIYQQNSDAKEVSADYHNTILQIINIKKNKIDPQKLKSQVDQYMDNHQQFFKSIDWVQKDWKNNHFQSMKLFKEILSMNKLEISIIQPQLSQTNNRVLSDQQLICIFNYAECFANNDTKLLNHYYSELLQITQKQKQQKKQEQIPLKKLSSTANKFPQNLQQIYNLANKKKKDMKKDKTKATTTEQPFNINVKEFLKGIGW